MRILRFAVFFPLLSGCASGPGQSVDETIPTRPAGSESCERAASLAGAGELKPAVDEMAVVEQLGVRCPEEVLKVVETARARLEEADALVHSAQEKRRQGDLAGAATDLGSALATYPKYYWAEKQLREIQQQISAQSAQTRLRERQDFSMRLSRSLAAETQGDLDEASRLTTNLLDHPPTDPDSKVELVEYSRLLGLKLFSEGELTQARNLWQKTLALDPDNQKVREYLQEVNHRLQSLEEIKSKDDE